MNKKLIILPALTIFTLLLSGPAFAQTPQQSLAQKIAQKFGLKEADVKEVFNEYRTERHNKAQQQLIVRLDQLVKDKKITEEQKTAIITKLNELWQKRMSEKDTFKSMSPQQRKAEMDKLQQELQAWAKQHNIDLSQLSKYGFWKMGYGMGFKRGMMK